MSGDAGVDLQACRLLHNIPGELPLATLALQKHQPMLPVQEVMSDDVGRPDHGLQLQVSVPAALAAQTAPSLQQFRCPTTPMS